VVNVLKRMRRKSHTNHRAGGGQIVDAAGADVGSDPDF